MRWIFLIPFLLGPAAGLPNQNVEASTTPVAPSAGGPTPPSTPTAPLPHSTAPSSLAPTPPAFPPQQERKHRLDPRSPQDPALTTTPTPPLPIYGDDEGLDAAISRGLDDPDPDVREEALEWSEKYYQTTYYSCRVSGTYSHCGWHRPIVAKAHGGGAADAGGRGRGVLAVVAAAAAAVVGAL